VREAKAIASGSKLNYKIEFLSRELTLRIAVCSPVLLSKCVKGSIGILTLHFALFNCSRHAFYMCYKVCTEILLVVDLIMPQLISPTPNIRAWKPITIHVPAPPRIEINPNLERYEEAKAEWKDSTPAYRHQNPRPETWIPKIMVDANYRLLQQKRRRAADLNIKNY